MSQPHSVVHARSYADEVEKSPAPPPSKPKSEPMKGVVSSSLSLTCGRRSFGISVIPDSTLRGSARREACSASLFEAGNAPSGVECLAPPAASPGVWP
jgi:hypothetical protein